MAKTYLQIVNEAVDEAKVSVDALTSVNFASPPRTQLYDRFKRWVNLAYQELLQDRKDWHFRTERANVNIWPRLHLSGLSYVPAIGDVLEGASSGVRFTVKAVHAHEDVEVDTTVEHTVSVDFAVPSERANLILRENINRVSPSPSSAVGYLKAWGRYDFRSLVTQLEKVNIDTVMFHDLDGFSRKVIPLTTSQWPVDYSMYPWNGDYPLYMAESSQGSYDLYPMPMGECRLSFDFTRSIPTMVNYNDVPLGLPEEYHEYLVWKAVEEFADFDGNGKLYTRARKRTEKYRNYMERDEMPAINVAGWNGAIKRG